ncbi:MAG: hypothetical protein CEN89_761 [Candidatus Berkelbacteria bacterium Licking1014_7]|uniref:Uncharacterized protein n=1 Tax=Candidatus Berkelbacteria bacterium Licking1014_7 TaxID=2017147 RepID=A0A554LHH6_9BACT|nr:MAG: hypothetical protein CEN89_761 [Candidatus Berkelbacteria bacterium Licking1014_7]
MTRLKIVLIIFLILFFAGSIYLTWYITKNQQGSADVTGTSTSAPATDSSTSAGLTTDETSKDTTAEKVRLILQPGYNLKTLPYILSPNDGKTVFLGLKSQKADVLENDEWKNLLSDSRALTPGQGFVVMSENGEVYDLPVSATEIDQKTPFTIKLKSGWNAVGNPFTHDIKWNPIIKTSRGSTTLTKALEANFLTKPYAYDSAGKEYSQLEVNDTLKFFQGILIKSGGNLDLILDPTLVP